ncbi:unnamed protein product [Linum trigynum]|uniref:RNase H type-1 domain-containing protein n=1 Tax=Linum trigynum TaxID=586398 RepID=A0AAV2F5W5_9ROSI
MAVYWKIIWNLPAPERIRSFMWLVLLGKLVTNEERFHRKLALNPFCMRCNGSPETIVHILRDCSPAAFFWSRQIPGNKQAAFFGADQQTWLRDNLQNGECDGSRMCWAAFFSMAAWLIWKNRCTTVFKGIGVALSSSSLTHSIMAKTILWNEAWHTPTLRLDGGKGLATRVMTAISWAPPPAGWVMLNIDGASNGNPGPTGSGGLLRDSTRRWIAGFIANIGEASAALSKLWAFFHGLDLAWKLGHRALKIGSDSQLAIFSSTVGMTWCILMPLYLS